jgi:hypothetical protein
MRRHCIISGTGRAGTTFLVHLLSELGLDTGYDRGAISESSGHVDAVAWAGLEHDLRDPNAPYVVKSPLICNYIHEIAERRDVRIDHAIIPVRDLSEAAESRLKVQASHARWKPNSADGGLWDATSQTEQEVVLLRKQYTLLYHLARMNVPVTFLHFPTFATDAAYAFDRLKGIFGFAHGPGEFEAVFKAVSRPERIGRPAGDARGDASKPPSRRPGWLRWRLAPR